MKIHVTIKDNETNEIKDDFDCYAFVGGASVGGGETKAIVALNCDLMDLVAACDTSRDAIDEALDQNPLAETLYMAARKICVKKRTDTNES